MMISATVPPELLFGYEIGCLRGPMLKNVVSTWQLPALQKIYGNNAYVKAYMAWDMHMLAFRFEVETKRIVVSYPAIEKGDAIELFIDTRNVKTARSTHRFYHHFFFLPERIEGVQCGECTHFRTEDRHSLALAKDFHIQVEMTKKGYTASIEIPAECLHGYHPEAGEHVGLYYRVHRFDQSEEKWAAEEWAFSSEKDLHLHPHLFPTIILKDRV